MGLERVLQAARRLIAFTAVAGGVAGAAPARERVAVIDVGPADGGVARRAIHAELLAGGLAPLIESGIDEALAGNDVAPDAAKLAASLAEAQRAFGALDCPATIAASTTAIGIAAARQAAGLPVPELPRAWTYVLLCADRTGNGTLALTAAARLRTVGGSNDVPDDVWAKYPEVDAVLDRDQHAIEIAADVPGAVIWIDHRRAGTSPLQTTLAAGEHVIAAAAPGGRRGFAMGTAVKTQATLVIPTSNVAGMFGAIATRVAGWGGVMPAASEIGAVLDAAKVRVAIVRRGTTIEAWGRPARAGVPHRLGGEDGTRSLDEGARLVALIADRVQLWNDRAPDPDQELLLETDSPLLREKKPVDEPTKWWVYASIGAAIVAGGVVLFAAETSSTTQRVELHLP